MSTNRADFKTFLSKHISDSSLVESVMVELEPFFVIDDKKEIDKYLPLVSASEELRVEVAEGIAKLLGISLPKVVFISLSHPIPKPDWMSQDEYDYLCLGGAFIESVQYSSGPSLGNFADVALWADLEDRLWANSLEGAIYDCLGRDHSSISGGCLFFYLGFIITGDKEMVDRLTPFVRLLPRVGISGEKIDEPGTWLVLVA